jgi:hypothetical protein
MANRTHQHSPGHDPRTSNPCSVLRHPAQAKQGRALARHLAEHPFPTQQQGVGR